MRDDFRYQVVEHGLGHLPFTEKQVVTPTGNHPPLSSVLAIFMFFITPLVWGTRFMLCELQHVWERSDRSTVGHKWRFMLTVLIN